MPETPNDEESLGFIAALRRGETFRSLRHRDYRLFWLGQSAASMGLWMDRVARSWLVYSITQSPLQLGLVHAVSGVPLLAFGLIAGVFADRYGRKAQLIIAQATNALLNIVLATLILTGQMQVWHIYVIAFLTGTVQAFQQPARQVLISDLVGQRELLNAIALNSAVAKLSESVGPAVVGVLIWKFGVGVSYYAQAVLYALATLWTVQMKIPKSSVSVGYAQGFAPQSLFGSIKEGFAYIASHRLILALMVLTMAPAILAKPYISLMPIFAIDVLHGDARTQGLLLTMVGVGALLGALAIASLNYRQGGGKLLLAGAAGFGLSLVFFSRSPVLGLAMVFTFLAGFSNTSYSSQNQTMLQIMTPPELRGRVLGVYLLDRGLAPLGSFLAGALASLLGGPWAVTIMGTSCLLLVVGVAVFTPGLRKWNFESGYEEANTRVDDGNRPA